MVHKKTKIVAGIGFIFFLASLACFSSFSYVVYNHKIALNEQLVRAAEIKARESALGALIRVTAVSKEERTALRSYVLEDDRVIDLLSLIENLGKEQGVVVTTNTLTVSSLNAEFENLQITVSAEGSYDAIMHVLGLLETLPYQSAVTKVLLSKVSEGGALWKGTFDVQVTKFKKI